MCLNSDIDSNFSNEPTEQEKEYAQDFYEYCEQEREKAKNAKPKIIFKYISAKDCEHVDRCCDIFNNNRLYMPSISELNDPLEGWNSQSLDKSALEKREQELRKYRVICFSEEALMSTQWAHYAANYKGIAIGFWTNGVFEDIHPIEYYHDHQWINFGYSTMFYKDLYIKTPEWKSEKEWRIVRSPTAAFDCEKFFRFSPNDIACVLFGNKICECAKNHIMVNIAKVVPVFDIKVDTDKLCLYAENSSSRAYKTEEILKIIFNLKNGDV